jgi:hypothetical protein
LRFLDEKKARQKFVLQSIVWQDFKHMYFSSFHNFKIGFLITVAVLVLSSFYFFSRYISKKSREL